MTASTFIPKIFGWCHDVQTKTLARMRKLEEAGKMESLTSTEATALTLLLLDHIAAHLEKICQGRRLTTSYLGNRQKEQIVLRKRAGRRLTPAHEEKLEDVRITVVGEGMVHLLRYFTQRLARRYNGGPSATQVLLTKLRAGSHYLHQITSEWERCPTAEKFLLLGGEKVIAEATKHNPPPKFLKRAIHELGVRGALPVGRRRSLRNEFPFESVAEAGKPSRSVVQLRAVFQKKGNPFVESDDVFDRRSITFSDDHLYSARRIVASIKDHPELILGERRDEDIDRPYTPQMHGLTAVPARTGRKNS